MGAKAARRYAKAFLLTAIEKDSLEKAKEDILLIRDTLGASGELRTFLKSPIVKKEKKKAVLEAIFGDKIGDLTLNLLGILSDKSREGLLEEMTRHFMVLYNIHHGIIEAEVKSASKMDQQQLSKLTKKLESITGKKVNITSSVAEDLIGGMTVRVNDTVVDGSVKYKLNELKNRFTSAGIE